MSERMTTFPEYRADQLRERINTGWEKDASGCHVWKGNIDRHGYGRFAFYVARYQKRESGAHRMAYLALVGDIPEDGVVDHLCRNRACVNTDHMEIVTNRVNILRGATALANRETMGPLRKRKSPEDRRRKSHCKHGHEFTGDNLLLGTQRNGGVLRICRTCRLEVSRRQEAKRRQKRLAERGVPGEI